MIGRLLLALLVGWLSLFPIVPVTTVSAQPVEPEKRVLITEIKLGGGAEPKEFVEVFNDSELEVDLTGWVIEYAKSSFLSTKCEYESWKDVASPSSQVNRETLSGQLAPGAFLETTIGMNDSASGSVQLVSGTASNFVKHDLVSWGEESPCGNSVGAATLPANGKSITRVFDPDGHPIDTDSDATDFNLENTPTPGTDICLELDCYEETGSSDPVAGPRCLVHLSEILANPSGTDAGHEYIELYNPTLSDQPLEGCRLKTGASGTEYNFSDNSMLEPGEYRIFTSEDLQPTGLQVVNSGGEVWLFDDVEELIVMYPAADDNESWSLIENQWLATDKPTPNASNQKSETSSLSPEEDETLDPCPAGKFRNPETNRCKNIEADEGLVACKQGQERNPDTNRCRGVAGATTTLAACQPGYERNTQTNRCRKVSTGLSNPASLLEPNDSNVVTNLNYIVLGLVSALVVAYGVYEYRHDFVNAYARVKQRINKSRLLK